MWLFKQDIILEHPKMEYKSNNLGQKEYLLWFSNSDYSMNRKRERFKVYEFRQRLNRDNVIINLKYK